MFNPNEDLDYEDILNIVTPGGIDRRIIDLDAAWQQLRNDPKLLPEIQAWEKWSKSVLDSWWISKGFATGILEELDTWKKRYALAYEKSTHKEGPRPDVFDEDTSIIQSPFFWIAITAVVGTGLYFYAAKYKKLF